jgi:PEP-CTERM motif
MAGVGLCVAVAPAAALPVLLDFEGIANTEQIHTFYAGGDSTGTSFPATGTNFGVTFATGPLFDVKPTDIAGAVARSNNSVDPDAPPSLFSFLANSGNLESPHKINQFPYPTSNLSVMDSGGLIVGSPSFAQMTSAATFELSSLSFWYSSSQIGAKVEALNSANEVVGTVLLSYEVLIDGKPKIHFEAGCDNNSTDTPFCNWTKVTGDRFEAGAGTGPISSLRFYNDGAPGTATLYDNIQFNNASPAPEPSTYVLMALGLLGIALKARRRRQA